MRKLIERAQQSAIVCDNPICDYTLPYTEENEKNLGSYVNVTCPKCGDVLLTEEDYEMHLKIVKYVNFLNKYFSWVTLFYSKKSKDHVYCVHVHDGINIQKKQ
jgi:ssDNA-binding Zn-finger/Zn-ribbon topoisomerase 1